MKQVTIFTLALFAAFAFGACGGDEAPTQPPVVIPDVDEPDGDVDDGEVTPPDVSEDTTEDVDVTGDADTVDVGPCENDSDCDGVVEVTSCQSAVCGDDGICVAEDGPLCCTYTSDCIGLLEPGDCEQLNCIDGECQVQEVENCCKTNADCADLADGCCTTATCGDDGFCDVETSQNCCGKSEDCDDGNPVTTDVCVDACADDGCANQGPPCEENELFVNKGFDDGTLQLLKVADADGTDDVTVSAVKGSNVTPEWSAYFGDPACKTYYNGPMVDCVATDAFAGEGGEIDLELSTEAFGLNPEAGAALGFWVNMSGEPEVDFGPPIGKWAPDYLRVVVNDGADDYTVWKSTDSDALGAGNTTNGAWMFQVATLSPFTNKSITVTFQFVADDDANFNINLAQEPWKGAYVDGVVVKSVCEEVYCDEANPGCPDDFNGCSSQACSLYTQGSGGVCFYETSTPGADCQGCTQVADCGSDACFDYACDGGICQADLKVECCEPSSSFPWETAPGDVAYEGFEDPAAFNWEISDPYDDNVSWQLSPVLPFQGAYALYFGDPLIQKYQANPPNPAVATAWTPYFDVDADEFKTPIVSFWLWMSTEFDPALTAADCSKSYDQLTLLVEATGAGDAMAVWDSCTGSDGADDGDNLSNTTLGKWIQVGVDLSAYGGESVRLGFNFDSGDPPGMGIGNYHDGVRIDDVTVTSVCGASPCASWSDCVDANSCTDDVCELGSCSNVQVNPLCCDVDNDCDDSNGCTIDTCANGSCGFVYDDNMPPSCCSEGAWLGSYTQDFEGGLGMFSTVDDTPPVAWHVSTSDAYSGVASANFSDPGTGTYANPGGGASTGQLVSSPIQVPPYEAGKPYAQFMFAMSTEWDDISPDEFDPLFVVDQLSVMVSVVGETAVSEGLWYSHYIANSTHGEWLKTRVDLDAYRGKLVQLIFKFESDGPKNAFAGPFIDDVSFGTSCLPSGAFECVYGGDCNASDECKVAFCSDTFKCEEAPKDTPECCEPYTVPDMTLTFEGADDGWTFDSECGPGELSAGTPLDEYAVWGLTDQDGAAGILPKQGDQVLYFGNGVDYGGGCVTNEDTGEVICPAAACGNATSPAITLGADNPWDLDAWVYLDIGKDNACNGGDAPWADVFRVEIIDDGTGESTDVLLKPGQDGCGNYNKWYKPESVNLDAWAGKTIRVRFHFHTFDTFDNGGKGLAIDKVEFTQGCAG